MQGYRDDGVVLRTQKLGEADRIITILTRHNGRVRAVAKGVRRTKSRWGARLEPFTHVDVMVHNGRSLDVITQAEVIRAYGKPLVSDYPKYTAGQALLETAERFTPVEKEPAIRQFLLLVGGLRALGDAIDPADAADGGGPVSGDASGDGAASGGTPVAPSAGPAAGTGPAQDSEAPRDPRMVLDAYFLRSLTFAGYAPALEECARCGAPGATGKDASAGSTASAGRADARDAASAVSAGSNASGAGGAGVDGVDGVDGGVDGGVAAKPLVAFALAAGGMVCAGCRPPGAASPAPQTLALMVELLRGDWDKAMRSERRHRVECSGLVAAYLQWHLEHSIRSLRHVERA